MDAALQWVFWDAWLPGITKEAGEAMAEASKALFKGPTIVRPDCLA